MLPIYTHIKYADSVYTFYNYLLSKHYKYIYVRVQWVPIPRELILLKTV